jgi:Kef-type K+ transport system membrane component KefB
VVAFSFLTPFFFLKGGMNVSAGALWGNLGVLALLFGGKMVPKLAGVYPFARRFTAPHGVFTTLLMSTGLTFGTISALYGLTASTSRRCRRAHQGRRRDGGGVLSQGRDSRMARGQMPCLPGARIPSGSTASLIVSTKRR